MTTPSRERDEGGTPDDTKRAPGQLVLDLSQLPEEGLETEIHRTPDELDWPELADTPGGRDDPCGHQPGREPRAPVPVVAAVIDQAVSGSKTGHFGSPEWLEASYSVGRMMCGLEDRDVGRISWQT